MNRRALIALAVGGLAGMVLGGVLALVLWPVLGPWTFGVNVGVGFLLAGVASVPVSRWVVSGRWRR